MENANDSQRNFSIENGIMHLLVNLIIRSLFDHYLGTTPKYIGIYSDNTK